MFAELDQTLQQAFLDYLEERGVNGEFGMYLMELANDKLEVSCAHQLVVAARRFMCGCCVFGIAACLAGSGEVCAAARVHAPLVACACSQVEYMNWLQRMEKFITR